MVDQGAREIDPQTRDTVRAEVYSLVAGLLAGAPSRDQLASLAKEGILDLLRQRMEESGLGDLPELSELTAAMGTTDETSEALRREFNVLFLGPGKLSAPPWESVYLSPDRLVMQAPAQEVLREYVDAGLGYDGMIGCPPDHVAKELGFMAALISVVAHDDADQGAIHQRQQHFLLHHLLRWIPRFCTDLEAAENARCYRIVARLLRRFLEREERLLCQ
jgi:TorA maturation chaperone TorD